MPKIPTFEATKTVGTEPLYVRASEDAFGGAQARSMGDLSKGLEVAGSAIDKVQAQDDEIWATDAFTRAQMHWINRLGENRIAIDTDKADLAQKISKNGGVPQDATDENGEPLAYVGQGTAAKIMDEFNASADDFLSKAPSGRAKMMLWEKMKHLQGSVYSHAMSAEVASKVSKKQSSLVDAVSAIVNAHRGDMISTDDASKGLDQLKGVYGLNKGSGPTISGMEHDVDRGKFIVNSEALAQRGDLTPEQKILEENKLFEQVMPSIDRAFKDQAPNSYENNRVEFERQKDRVYDTLKRTGQFPNDINAYDFLIVAGRGGGEKGDKQQLAARRAITEISNAKKAYAFSSEISQKNFWMWDALKNKIPDPEVRKEVESKLTDSFQKISKGDPSQVILDTSPDVSSSFDNWKSLFADNNSDQIQAGFAFNDFAVKTLAQQTIIGVDRDSQSVLPIKETKTIASSLNALPASQKLKMIASLKKSFGDYYGNVVREMSENGLHPLTAVWMTKEGEPSVALDAEFADKLSKDDIIRKRFESEEAQKIINNEIGFRESGNVTIYKNSSLSKLQEALAINTGDAKYAQNAVNDIASGAVLRAERILTENPKADFASEIKKGVQFYVDDTWKFGKSNGNTFIIPKRTLEKEYTNADVQMIQSVAEGERRKIANVEGFDWNSFGKWAQRTMFLLNPIGGIGNQLTGQDLSKGLPETKVNLSKEIGTKWIGEVESLQDIAKRYGTDEKSIKEKVAYSIAVHSYWASNGEKMTLMYDDGGHKVPITNNEGNKIQKSIRDLRMQGEKIFKMPYGLAMPFVAQTPMR